MPIDYNDQQPLHHVLVWEHSEPDSFFQNALGLLPIQQQELQQRYQHAKARHDWLASRHALQLLCGQHCSVFYKDAAGKLRVPEDVFYYSISHSGNFVAVAQAPTAVGIDVQVVNAKLMRIAHKYIAPEVLAMIAQLPAYQDYLHYYWGIKEALFKAYGQGKVNFINHLHLVPFEASEEGQTLAFLQKPATGTSAAEEFWYKILYKKTANYYLCVAIAL